LNNLCTTGLMTTFTMVSFSVSFCLVGMQVDWGRMGESGGPNRMLVVKHSRYDPDRNRIDKFKLYSILWFFRLIISIYPLCCLPYYGKVILGWLYTF
jgi:hypothetical protein